ncbi:MAG: FixH family protein [Dehalococcoidia bacterium]
MLHRTLAAAAIALLAAALVLPSTASAHERRTVGGYDFVIGFFVEPALEGEKNGLDLRISKDGKPVEGADKTLKFDVTHVQSEATRSFPIRGVFGTPGRYTADFVPTLPGQYRFKISGNINGTAIDATFESGPGTFSNIEPVKDLMFPVAAAQPRELEGALRGASEDAAAALAAASTARTLALGGIVVGIAGLGVGAAGFMAARRPRA